MSKLALEPAVHSTEPILAGAISEKDLAVELGCCTRSLADKRRKGTHAPYFRIAHRVYYRRAAVLEWLAASEKKPVRRRAR